MFLVPTGNCPSESQLTDDAISLKLASSLIYTPQNQLRLYYLNHYLYANTCFMERLDKQVPTLWPCCFLHCLCICQFDGPLLKIDQIHPSTLDLFYVDTALKFLSLFIRSFPFLVHYRIMAMHGFNLNVIQKHEECGGCVNQSSSVCFKFLWKLIFVSAHCK